MNRRHSQAPDRAGCHPRLGCHLNGENNTVLTSKPSGIDPKQLEAITGLSSRHCTSQTPCHLVGHVVPDIDRASRRHRRGRRVSR
jgi:hypothetical protein